MEQKDKRGFQFYVFWHNFLRTLPHMVWLPLLLCAAFGFLRYYQVRRSYSPSYEVFAVYRVSARRTSSIDLSSTGYYMDANAASRLAATYPYAMSSDLGRSLLREKYGTSSLPASVSCRRRI